MGCRTLAIQKRSSEMWTVPMGVKAEFSKFGDVLNKVSNKLQEASNVVEKASVRTRVTERTLKNVEAPLIAESELLMLMAELPEQSAQVS